MAITDSRFEYVARMHRVVEHIDRHLDEPLDLETLAASRISRPFTFIASSRHGWERRSANTFDVGDWKSAPNDWSPNHGCQCCRWLCLLALDRLKRSRAPSRRGSVQPRRPGGSPNVAIEISWIASWVRLSQPMVAMIKSQESIHGRLP